MAQLEREAAGFDESSEPTSMTNSSTVEGEHTIQDVQNEDEDERTLNIEAAQAELNDKIEEASEVAQEMIQAEPDVVETYSNNLRPNEDEIQLLRLKLEEVRIFFIHDRRSARQGSSKLKRKKLEDNFTCFILGY